MRQQRHVQADVFSLSSCMQNALDSTSLHLETERLQHYCTRCQGFVIAYVTCNEILVAFQTQT